jgi:hypothetical protein
VSEARCDPTVAVMGGSRVIGAAGTVLVGQWRPGAKEHVCRVVRSKEFLRDQIQVVD